MDHGFRTLDQFRERSAVGEIARHPLDARVPLGRDLACQRPRGQTLAHERVDRGLSDETRPSGDRERHSSTM